MMLQADYQDIPPVLDVAGVAAVLGCSEDTVRTLISTGRLNAVRLGRVIRIPRHSLVGFLVGTTEEVAQ